MIAAVNTSPFNVDMLRKTNVWYTFRDGNWSDGFTWISNGLNRGLNTQPKAGDTVFINHYITMDIATIHVNCLYISGTLKGGSLPGATITVDGDCQVSGGGLIDFTSQITNLVLNGYNNLVPVAGFLGGNSTVTYNGRLDQALLNINYRNLTTSNTGKKYQVSDIAVLGNLNAQSDYECGAYNLTVNGTSLIGTVGSFTFSKNSSTGSILFVGNADFEGSTDLSTGNPNIEFRGGMVIHTFSFISGSGTFTFSTNSQTINCSAYLGGTWNAQIVISGAITITLTGTSPLQVNSTINGTVSGSVFNNDGVLYLGIDTLPMTIGNFNYQHGASSTIGYVFNGDFSFPYTSYVNLVIDGTGVKSQSGNTVVTQSLQISGNYTGQVYECNGFNLDVKGVFTNKAYFKASAFCNILFEGAANFINGPDRSAGVDLRNGNPNVEFRGGLTLHTYVNYTGTGVFIFSTNNQNLDFSVVNGGVWAANILISGATTLTFLDGSNSSIYNVGGTLTGDNASSKFVNSGVFCYANAQQPMRTGILDSISNMNTFVYSLAGNQDITPGNYKNLTLQVSGIKRLMGNVHVSNIYLLTAPVTLNANGFVLSNP